MLKLCNMSCYIWLIKDFNFDKKRDEYTRKTLKEKEPESRFSNSKLLCLTFDLQTNQPIPYLNTTILYINAECGSTTWE